MKNSKKEVSTMVVSANVHEVVTKLSKQANPLIKKLDGFTILSKDDYDKAAEMVAKLKNFAKEANTQEKTITDPANLIIKNARSIFKPFKDLVSSTEASIKRSMLEFVNKREAEAKKIESKFEAGEIKKVSTVVSKTTELRNNSSDNSQVRKVYVLTILDEKKIPREFLVPDEAKIRDAFKTGKQVPGCEWKQQNQIAI